MNFKVGDWVRTIDDGQLYQLVKVNEEDEEVESGQFTLYFYEIELWWPKEGEYCWFWSKDQLKYNGTPYFGKYGVGSYTLDYYDSCEPFIGQLPSWIKDK